MTGTSHTVSYTHLDVYKRQLLIAYGHIEYLDHRSSDGNKRTVYSLTAQRFNGRWLFTAYQNTPLASH